MRAVLCLVFWAFSFSAFAAEGPVSAFLVSEVKSFVPGQAFTVGLRLEQAKGWHTYWKNPGDAGLPTKIRWKLPGGFKAGEIRWPTPERFKDSAGLAGYGYLGEVLLAVEIKPPSGFKGKEAVLEARASWLACRDYCIPGKADLKLALPAGDKAEASVSAPLFAPLEKGFKETGLAGLAWILLLAFAGGILLNLMPCVLPALSLKILALAHNAHGDPKETFKLGLAYTLGVMLSFWTLAIVVLALKTAGAGVGWGFQFQNPLFVLFLCMVVTVFSLNLFGVFEIYLPGTLTQGLAGAASKPGLAGSLFDGAFTTLLATPCTAPFLGTALGFAFGASGLVLFLVFTFAGLGLALPALALSWRPQALTFLPKPGPWMERLKQALGFLLLATALWLLWVLGSQAGLESVIQAAAFLLVTALVLWIAGAFMTLGISRRRLIVLFALNLALLIGGYVLFLKPLVAGLGNLKPGAMQAVGWERYSAKGLEQARAKGKVVFLDFTAQWCWTCKVNERVVLDSAEVDREFVKRGVVLMRADYTSQDAGIFKLLQSFGAAGVPLYVVYPADKDKEPKVLPTILTKEIVLGAISK